MSKIHIWDIKLVCYLKEATRSIFLTSIGLQGLTRTKRAKNRSKKGAKRVQNTNLSLMTPNGISKCPKYIVEYYNWFSTYTSYPEAYF